MDFIYGYVRRESGGKRIVPRPLQTKTIEVRQSTRSHLKLKNVKPYADWNGENEPLDLDGRTLDVKWRLVGNNWKPLGPIATPVYSRGPLDWTLSPDSAVTYGKTVVKAVVEVPEFLSYVGFPAYVFVAVRLASANVTMIGTASWNLVIDVSMIMDSAVITPVQSLISGDYTYFGAWVAGLLKSVSPPKVVLSLDAFWDNTAINNGDIVSYDAFVNSTMQDVYQPIENVVVRGTGAMPEIRPISGGWEVVSEPHLKLVREPSELPPSTAEDWVEV